MKNSYVLAFFAFVIGIISGYAIFSTAPSIHFSKEDYDGEGFSGKMALLRNGRETGLSVPFDVTGTYRNVNSILISPAGDEVLYTLWENARVEIFVSNTDGTHARKIAEQEAAEGSGELDLSSLSWSEDGAKISYIESGMVCGARICDMPNDFFLQRTLYTVDLTTGQKTSRIIE